MYQQQPKKKLQTVVNDNILESIRGVSGSVGQTISHDVAGRIPMDILRTLTGGGIPQSGELRPNEALNLTEQQPEPQPIRRMPEFRPMPPSDEAEVKQKIDAIRTELKALSQSIKALHQDIDKAVSEVPVHPGVYHITFLEQLKSFLLMLRTQVEDSRTWLHAFQSRKKKQGYWGMYKKHGTSFGMSNERTLATSAG